MVTFMYLKGSYANRALAYETRLSKFDELLIFKSLDTNNDGKLVQAELDDLLPQIKAAGKVAGSNPANNNDEANFDEFSAWFRPTQTSIAQEKLEKQKQE